ncbi:MAG: GGDEF domain-containing protein, partial [Candidatus Sulfotelmatobacter sp.]
MASPQTAAPDTLPANFFSSGGASAPDTLPANFFSQTASAPATLPADFFSAQTAPATLPANFFSQQPAHDPNDRLAVSGQGEIRPYEPSIWDRIKSAVTAAIPSLSSRTVYNPKYGQMQLLSPEEALTPAEQQRHPMLTGAGEIVGGLTSPESVELLAATGGLGELPGAAAMLPRLMSAGFGAQAIYSGVKNIPAIRDAWDRGDVSEVERLLTHSVLNLAIGAAASQHAATGAGAVTGKPNEPVTAGVETRAIEPTSAAGEVLSEHAPSVRVADNAALARQVIEDETSIRPVQGGSGDRRVDVARRARVADMSPEEMQRELLTSKVTGLPNRRAFDESDSPAVAMSDADGLKALNDKFGYAAGDVLLRAKAEALREAGVEAYHDKGDEFLYRGNSPAELTEKLETAKQILRDKTIIANVDGEVKRFKGANFSYGAGKDISEAESGLKADKAAREAAGERARGQLRGITELGPSEGAVDQGATQEETDPQQARVTGPRDIAAFRNRNSARVVSDDHIPVVSRDEVLSQSIQNVIDNSGELRRAGVDPSTIQTTGD